MDSGCTLLSSLEEKNAVFNWTIENWNLIANTRGEFKPKSFSVVDSRINCSVILNFSERKISVSVEVCRSSIALLRSKISMMLVTQQKSDKILDEDIVTKNTFLECYMYHFKLPDNHEIKEYVGYNDSLTFRCSVNYFWDKTVVRYTDNIEDENCLYRKKLTLTNYGSLYEKKQMCDVTFVTAEGELKAHSVILALASPYFLAMFSHKNLKESTDHIVDLTNDSDVSLDVYRGFLDYVYGLKSVECLENIVMELLVLADKYDMQELKNACEQYLCDDLDNLVTQIQL